MKFQQNHLYRLLYVLALVIPCFVDASDGERHSQPAAGSSIFFTPLDGKTLDKAVGAVIDENATSIQIILPYQGLNHFVNCTQGSSSNENCEECSSGKELLKPLIAAAYFGQQLPHPTMTHLIPCQKTKNPTCTECFALKATVSSMIASQGKEGMFIAWTHNKQ